MRGRSFHFIPAHQAPWFEGIGRLGADAYVLDLEDAVPASERVAARDHLRRLFRGGAMRECFIRIHEPGHAEYAPDAALLRELPAVGVVVPKCDGLEALVTLDQDIQLDGRPVIVMVESFVSVLELPRLLAQRPVAVAGVGLGFEDMLTALPHAADELTTLIQHVRSSVALACRAHGVLAIDGISGADEPEAVFERHCAEGRACGLHGKFSIHPRQVAPINRVFGPSAVQSQWAQRIADLTGLRDDFGYQRVQDLVITPPKIKKARHILETARDTAGTADRALPQARRSDEP